MKIHFIISSLKGNGAERVLVKIADALVRKGFDISILTFNDEEDYKLNNDINRIRLHGGSFKNHTIRSIINLIKYYRFKKNRPDIAISFITQTSFISIIAAKLYGIKIIASEHNSYLRNIMRTDLFTKKYVYRFADKLVVLTSFDLPYYRKYKANVMVIPNPCSFEPIENTNQNREKVILVVGDLNRYRVKGFDRILYILKPLFKKHPEWKLKILGKGDRGMKFLTEEIKKLDLNQNVELSGFKKNIHEIMQVSEIFALPSQYEGLPMVLIEAMSQGMACIAYDCVTGPRDIINDNVDGILIEDQNETKMREGLDELMSNPDLRNKLRQESIHSIERYDVEKVVTEWINLFDEIL